MAKSNLSDRPNLILLTTDQQRGDCIGIDEQSPAALQTPNLDALARSGVRFRRGYSECPSCFPARRSLMSGMSPAAQGMVGMQGSEWNPPHTLAGELHNAGYHTYLVGKLHLQPTGKRFGFDHQVLSDAPLDYHDAYARWLRDVHGRRDADAVMAHGHDPNGWTAMPTHLPLEQTHTFWCVSQAIEFLHHQRDPSAPFFLNLSLFDPHPPITPPAEYYRRYVDRELPEPVVGDWARDWPRAEKGLRTDASRLRLDRHAMHCCRAGYYATINFIDDQVGRLLQYLRRNKLMANTAVLFTSDHGEMLGDHHLYRKCMPYEASARVPYFVHVPARFGGVGERVVDQPVGLQDVMPTLLDLAGAPAPKACTGRSLAPLLRGQDVEIRDMLHGEHGPQYNPDDGNQFLVSSRHKYIWWSHDGREQLFDLHKDPQECVDLAGKPQGRKMLTGFRRRMVDVLRDRPEGFVRDGRLAAGARHQHLLPGLTGDRFYPYL
jgi:arylsulfatase A-like enzyme